MIRIPVQEILEVLKTEQNRDSMVKFAAYIAETVQ